MSDTTTETLTEFDVYCEIAGTIRVKARDADHANAIAEGWTVNDIVNKISDGLSVAWPEPAEKKNG